MAKTSSVRRTHAKYPPPPRRDRRHVAVAPRTRPPRARTAGNGRGEAANATAFTGTSGRGPVDTWSPKTRLRPPKTLPVLSPSDLSEWVLPPQMPTGAPAVGAKSAAPTTTASPSTTRQPSTPGLTPAQVTVLGLGLGAVAALLLGVAVLLRLRHVARTARTQKAQAFGLRVHRAVEARRSRPGAATA